MDLADRRDHYETEGIDLADVDPDPFAQFEHWYRDAEAADLWEPNAMVVATVDADGRPAARFVLLKSFDQAGFVFYTNHESAKARSLDRSGVAGLTFGWLPLRRQVRIEGTVQRTPEEESAAYFARRPRGSQIGAWASPQSQPVESREELDERYAEVAERFDGREIERPPSWGGYRVTPETFEFWQGRPDRFHDRIRYRRNGARWVRDRLAP